MSRKEHRNRVKSILEAAIAAQADATDEPKYETPGFWGSWFDPAPARDRSRRWLSMWLKGNLKDIPADQSARYLQEMAEDLARLGSATAVDRFIDKILPPITSNSGPDVGPLRE